jgi:hypothetical protein
VGLRVALLLWSSTVAAAPSRCQILGRPYLEGRVRGTRELHRAVDARMGETIEVFVSVAGRRDGRAVRFSESGAPGRTSWQGCGAPWNVRWRRVEPRMQHERTPAPNANINVYANAVVFGPRHGRWIGFDRLEYFATPLEGYGSRRVVTDATPMGGASGSRSAEWAALGTMRLAATLEVDGVARSTAGEETAPSGQISDEVFRYSIRRDDTFLGWLTSFFNVPYLFGSAGKGVRAQAERYIGADCADVLVAALRRSGHRELEYASVVELVDAFGKVGGPTRVGPQAASAPPLRVGEAVRPGDLLALDYVGAEDLPRAYDHIVAFVADRGPNGAPDGRLGPEDLVADSGSAEGLKLAPLGDQGEVQVVVLRPRAASPRH